MSRRERLREGLARLDVRRMVLAIHDAAFPSAEDDDTGQGTPASPAGLEVLRFARDEGFDTLQLGPSGRTEADFPSPYDGTVFARSELGVSLARLADDPEWAGLLPRRLLDDLVARRPPGGEERVPHGYAHRAHAQALGAAYDRLRRAGAAPEGDLARIAEELAAFRRRHASWVEEDAAARAASLPLPLRDETEARTVFAQYLAHAHHALLRREAESLGLRLYADLQVGLDVADASIHPELLLPGYRLGAPPSRTNPEGQPWGYGVLHPERVRDGEAPGPVLRFTARRLEKLFAEYHGLRVDHPHGWIDPWVYRADDPDPSHAVRSGARLLGSPDLADHPELARFAIPHRDQLHPDPATPRYADAWVVSLRPEQVERYAELFDRIVAAAEAHGAAQDDLACEVLSTLPTPVRAVLARHGLGRFRVSQKADLDDPDDVYRVENAAPQDWVLFGNHDTPTLWQRVDGWSDAERDARAAHLAQCLVPEPGAREAFARRCRDDRGFVAHACVAELLVSPARHVVVALTDLFGFTEPYNRPGAISPENWSLRLPRGWAERHRTRRAAGRALSLPRALALALRARPGLGEPHALCEALERDAAADAAAVEGTLPP